MNMKKVLKAAELLRSKETQAYKVLRTEARNRLLELEYKMPEWLKEHFRKFLQETLDMPASRSRIEWAQHLIARHDRWLLKRGYIKEVDNG